MQDINERRSVAYFSMEASGTSGMKAALNGVPNLSVLDGWWIEGHIEGLTGWSIAAASWTSWLTPLPLTGLFLTPRGWCRSMC